MYLNEFENELHESLSNPGSIVPFARRHEEEKQAESMSWDEYLDAAWTGLKHGVTTIAPERMYRVARTLGKMVGSTDIQDWAARNIEEELAARERDPWYRPDPKWMESEWGRSLYEGFANFSAAVPTMVPGIVLTPLTGGTSLGAAFLAGAVSGGSMAGLAEYDSFVDEAYQQMSAADSSITREVVESEKFWGAVVSAVAEGGMSFLGDYAGGKLAGIVGKPAAKAASSVLTKTIKNVTSHMAIELGEEAATAYVQDWAREISSLDHQGRWDAIKNIIGPTLVAGGLGGIQNTVLKTGQEALSPKSMDEAGKNLMRNHDLAKRNAALTEAARTFRDTLINRGAATEDSAQQAALIADALAKRWSSVSGEKADVWFENIARLQEQGTDAGLSDLSALAVAISDPNQSFDNVVDQGVDFLMKTLPTDQQQALQTQYQAEDGTWNRAQVAEDIKAFIKGDDGALELDESNQAMFESMRDTLLESVQAVGDQSALRVSKDSLGVLNKTIERGIRTRTRELPVVTRDPALMNSVIESVGEINSLTENSITDLGKRVATSLQVDLLNTNAPQNAEAAFELFGKALSPLMEHLEKKGVLKDEAVRNSALNLATNEGVGVESFKKQADASKDAAVRTVKNKLTLLAAVESLKHSAAKALETKTVEDMTQARLLSDTVNNMLEYWESEGTNLGRAMRLRRFSKQDKLSAEKLRASFASLGGHNTTEALLTAIVNATDQSDIRRAMAVGRWAKTQDAVVEYVTSGMLFGPATHIVNGLSNTAQLVNELFTRAYAEHFGGKVEGGVVRGETMAMLHGVWKGINNVRETWRTHRSEFQPGAKGAVSAFLDANGMWGDAPDGSALLDTGHMSRAISSEKFGLSAQHGKVSGGLATAVDLIGRVMNLPFDLLLHSDQVFKTVAYGMELNAQCHRAGQGDANVIDTLMKQPPEELRQKARAFARRVTFQDDLGPIASKFDAVRNELPLTRLILPFLKTPVNIYKEGARMTPILNKLFGDIRKELNSADPATRQLSEAKLMVGTMIWSTALGLAAAGYVTGPGPEDYAEKQKLLATGWRPNALKIGEDYYQIDRLDPLAALFNTSAFLVEIKDHIQTDDLETAFSMGMGQSLRLLTNRTYLESFADAMELITNFEKASPTFQRRMGGMLVPASALMRTAVRNDDPFQREVDGFLGAIRANIPGATQSMPIKRDFLGQPIESLEFAGNNWLSPFQVGHKKDDVVYQEVARLQQAGFSAAPIPSRTIEANNQRHKMSGEQYSQFLDFYGNEAKVNGLTAKKALDRLVASAAYKGMKDDQKADAIKSLLSGYRKKAKEAIIAGDEKIRKSLDLKSRGFAYILGLN